MRSRTPGCPTRACTSRKAFGSTNKTHRTGCDSLTPSRRGQTKSRSFLRRFAIVLSILLLAAQARPQGQVVFDNRVPGTVVVPVYDIDFLSPTNSRSGNTSSGFPAGTQTYGSGPILGRTYSAQLFGGPTNTADADLPALLPIVTFRTDLAGYVSAPTNAVTVPEVPEGQRARLQLRVWDNENGAVTNWLMVANDPSISRGQSASFISDPLGEKFTPPANLIGLQSFNLVTLVPPPFSVRINFQPSGATIPPGYVSDVGLAFGDRGNGFTYGWNDNFTANAVDQNLTNSPDQRYDTFIYMEKTPGAFWEIAVPNGVYRVRAVAGDPAAFDSIYRIQAEGRFLISGTPTSTNRWFTGETVVDVNDSRLTLSSGDGSVNNRLDFLEITRIESPLLQRPAVPAIQGIGKATAKFAVERSTNLREWLPIGMATNAGGNSFRLIEPQTNLSPRLYRARTMVNPVSSIVYTNDFAVSPGSEWSTNLVEVTPVGSNPFLGRFGNNTVTLTLTNLPMHTKVSVAFDLDVIGSWDGNSSANGPDIWTFGVLNGPTLLSTTFQAPTQNPNLRQAFPGDYPVSTFLPLTGARDVGTLGYSSDVVYRLAYSFTHTNSSVTLTFSGVLTETLSAESWGIDNIAVAVQDDPY